MRPPVDIAAIDAATDGAIAAGHRIFQTHLYGDSDTEHVDILMSVMAPPLNAMVLDAGCGIGEVSRLMSAARPDLSFILMNLSVLQLSKCPVGEQYMHLLDDCHATILNDNVVDVAMYSSALCQMDAPVALAEAYRIIKPGGVLMVNDMTHQGDALDKLEQAVGARVLGIEALTGLIRFAGFEVQEVIRPQYDDSHFVEMAGNMGLADQVTGIKPIIIRAVSRKEAL